MKRKTKGYLFCAMVMICLFLGLWGFSQRRACPIAPEPRSEEPEVLDLTVQMVHGNDPSFSATLEDFIRCYNDYFRQLNGDDYFPDIRRWKSASVPTGIHSPYPARQFRFCEDEAVYSLPTVTVYTPMEERYIQEITINFDEHSYTEVGFQRFRQLCICAVKAFFPMMQTEAAEALCDEVLLLGSQNVFDSNSWFGNGATPSILFYKGEVGVYPYDAIGDWRRFCMIPVTEERLQEFQQKGVVLREME